MEKEFENFIASYHLNFTRFDDEVEGYKKEKAAKIAAITLEGVSYEVRVEDC